MKESLYEIISKDKELSKGILQIHTCIILLYTNYIHHKNTLKSVQTDSIKQKRELLKHYIYTAIRNKYNIQEVQVDVYNDGKKYPGYISMNKLNEDIEFIILGEGVNEKTYPCIRVRINLPHSIEYHLVNTNSIYLL